MNGKFPCTWYPIGFSAELAKKPLKKKMVGRDVVLFRNKDGAAQAVYAYCPHRGADLSLGCVRDGKLTCAYHGWEFNGEGSCLHIPSQPDKPVPKFAHTEHYPVMERAGLLWIYPDSNIPPDSLPPLQLFEELENQEYVLAPYESFWKAHFTRVVESVLDVVHLSFVHKDSSVHLDD
ncbi:aromatic ring-hydroxylating dioxygenase subunit alpha [Fictibacillus enclensis]|uniref:aromatic ring-hydroxylating oxygenase subunit alpha n=1 Tax=Fictibacillus enclensis TaxID=1017270 RepID=UPI0025A03F84|nr:aromatic ring-hydroxylating dioxygenase subunit alpha [Fictibacillus enclensis]MDM5337567.1 aromatic ring-hydroxylating dioxygenase subunit alpha [Fictibacillus enclensis]